ncbi:MAG: endonuclease I [Bacteroidetes bacterium]|nr:endonuclease I [Bacteroidota bacterium]
MRFLPLFFALFTFTFIQAQDPVFPALEGQDLYDAVVDAFKPDFTTGNSPSKDILFGEIYRTDQDSVTCVYTGYTVYVDPNEDPSQAAFAEGLNTEHTYPKAAGAGGGPKESDLHNLHPSREDVNGDRGNLPFGEVSDSGADNWYYQDQELFSPPTENIDLYSERLINFDFEPREDHKGNAARSVFYFYTMYRSDALNEDPDFFEMQREELCDWHAQDPVDPLEWERTWLIAAHQDDKPNPFILDCTLAARMYCPDLVVECPEGLTSQQEPTQELAARIDLFPNPSQGQLNIHLQLEKAAHLEINLLDLHGRQIQQLEVTDIQAGEWSKQLETGQLSKGWYGVQIRLYTDDGLAQMVRPWCVQ